MFRLCKITAVLCGLLLSVFAHAGKLAIVIDDFGYRPTEENKVLQMPPAISVAVLPNAPGARAMATKAHQLGHEVLIHLPMAPLSKQPLEKDTLTPEMSSAEIERIIRNAVNNVPYAVGLNNHMGSKMTSSLFGMQKVMQTLNQYNFYFLDSMTIGNSQSIPAAQGTHVKVLKRRVFLDDSQNESAIRQQFTRAVLLAQRNGYAIAIGHPHPNTVRVLQQMLPSLPADITLVRPSQLLNEPLHAATPPHQPEAQPKPHFQPPGECKTHGPLAPVPATRMLDVVGESVSQSSMVKTLKSLF
ncbi:divergent polysaccharide deacetylase family protein [Pantoea osteomyelitidis]|uniref:Divergent polysaccharide deacetylase family protein n=1 Tax=Pantoea osteomyelitidis TaxID=3230026 RepID=A0ABW7PQU7_9GAMM